jgi:hypothetical protein
MLLAIASPGKYKRLNILKSGKRSSLFRTTVIEEENILKGFLAFTTVFKIIKIFSPYICGAPHMHAQALLANIGLGTRKDLLTQI